MVKIKPLGKGFMIFLVFLLGMSWASFSFAATQQEINEAIRQKNEELQKINAQIQDAQKQLDSAKQQGTTLKNEIGTIDKQISQINLNIKSSQLTIQKLNLEIESLQKEIGQSQTEILTKKEIINEILKKIQQADEDTPLIVFLRNNALTDSFFEAQGLASLNASLSLEVNVLKEIQDQLNKGLQSTAQKNQEVKGENKVLQNKKTIVEDLKEDKQVVLTQTKNQEKTYQAQLTDLQKQQAAIADEIANFEEILRKGFDISVLPTKRPGVFQWPIKLLQDGGSGRISQKYGETAYSYLYKGKPHNGLDIATPMGTPIYATADGQATAVGNNDKSSYRKYQYGKYILIRHDNNLVTLYAHLSIQSVATGSLVKRGDIIGYSGNTGFSTGPHLHFGAYWAPSIEMKSIPPANGLVPIGVTVNPEDYL